MTYDDVTLEKGGIHYLCGDINEESTRLPIEWILKNELLDDPVRELKLVINSCGGSLTDAFALIDIMKGATANISTIGIGEVSSAGLAIFMAGEKGKRILTPNTAILSHQYSWGTYGKEHELVAAKRGFDLTTNQMLNHYKKCTGLTEKKIREFLLPASDVWLSAKDAFELGICDEIKRVY